MNITLSIMEDIENYYPNKRSNTDPFTFKEFESIDNKNNNHKSDSVSSLKGHNKRTKPLQESSINTFKSNHPLLNKAFTSPIKATHHNNNQNLKKRSPTTPTIALASKSMRRKFDIPKLNSNLINLSSPTKINQKSQNAQKLTKSDLDNDEIIECFEVKLPDWFGSSIKEANTNMELFIAQQKLKDMEEINEFLIMERKFELETAL
ncbi:hypothetical protein KGF54_004653 [Candida jiufengensis]|uniref:uncharacterized protein n=1 Tax=Candida jiufengensis TaxID=497108 RepID=UPI002224420C|nr:uncharacterized protein KGF54_004653 [Candida jiufengensis]KAI5951579.1 hypothetical protein KGF54_004653 [Candida jiufengensis]